MRCRSSSGCWRPTGACSRRSVATDATAPTLVIGWGSDLRRDDAAGRRAAEGVAARNLPGVEAIAVHQLTPELATALAGRKQVVFVDASVDADQVEVVPLQAAAGSQMATHHVAPQGLLALADRLADAPRNATLVTVPAVDLQLGTALSPTTTAAVSEAVHRIVSLCR